MADQNRRHDEKFVTYAALDSMMDSAGESEQDHAKRRSGSDAGIEMHEGRGRSISAASNISDYGKDIAPKEEVPLQIGFNILLLLFVLGLTTGVVNGCAQWANTMISQSQAQLIQSTVVGPMFFMMTTSAFAATSAYIIKYGGLAATIGSGMPEVKALLVSDFHHSDFPTIVSFKILCIRLFSLVTAVGSGLSIGIAAPLVHISICIAYTLMNIVPDFGEFLENHAIRKQIFAAAAAVGMTTVFNAPVGGLLLSIELTNTFYLVSNYWRSFMVATTGAVMYSVFMIARNVEGRIFQVPTEDNPFQHWEFALFALLGLSCGLLGLQYLKLHQAFFLFVKPYTIKHPVATAAVAGFTTALLIFSIGAYSINGVSESVIVHDVFEDCSISTMASRHGVDPLGGLFASLLVRVILTLMGTTLRISCGVFLPVLTIGSLLGRIFGQILQDMCGNGASIYIGGYAMVGAVAFVSGTTHTISVAVIVIEQTGQFSMLLPCLVGAVIACGITKSRSLSLYDQGMVNKGLESFDLLLKESGGFKYAADVMDAKVNSVYSKCTIADLIALLDYLKQSTFPVTSSVRSNRLIGSVDRQDVFAFLKSVFEKEGLYAYIRLKLAPDAHYEDRRLERLKQIEMRNALFNPQNIESSMQGMLRMRPTEFDEDGNPISHFKGMFGMLNKRSHPDLGRMHDEDSNAGSGDSLHSADSGFGHVGEDEHHGAPVANPLLISAEAAAAHSDFFTPTQGQPARAAPSTPGKSAASKAAPATPSSPLSSENLQQMTDGLVRTLKHRVSMIPGVNRDPAMPGGSGSGAAGALNAFDQARVDHLLAQIVDLTQEPLLPINGFPFTAHRYTTMDQLYVLFEMVKVNVVFVVTNTKRLEGMISKDQLMQNLKKKVK
jgi:H+/Cl- antiporter ClcA